MWFLMGCKLMLDLKVHCSKYVDVGITWCLTWFFLEGGSPLLK